MKMKTEYDLLVLKGGFVKHLTVSNPPQYCDYHAWGANSSRPERIEMVKFDYINLTQKKSHWGLCSLLLPIFDLRCPFMCAFPERVGSVQLDWFAVAHLPVELSLDACSVQNLWVCLTGCFCRLHRKRRPSVPKRVVICAFLKKKFLDNCLPVTIASSPADTGLPLKRLLF